jgi:metal-dependent HD superfamily phosphatase/phosphodiesterase
MINWFQSIEGLLHDIQNSIKKAERDRRSKSVFTAKIYEVIEGRVIPDWKKFINSGENKQSLQVPSHQRF